MTEQDVALARAEGELTNDESSLASEMARLAAAANEFERKLKSVKAALAEASLAGEQDPSLFRRVQSVATPPLEVEPYLEQSRAARHQAILVRGQAIDQARAKIQSWKQALSALNQQIQNDDKAAQRLVSQARAKARAAAEPQAATEVPLPTTSPPNMQPRTTSRTQLFAASSPQGREMAAAMAAANNTPPPVAPVPASAKRNSPRVKMQAAIDFGSENNFYSGFSANISDGGLFIATVEHLTIGTHVEVAFSLPSGEKVQAQGVVRWIREVDDKDPESFPGVGVQFSNLDASAHDAIKRFIAQRDPMFYVD